MISSTPDNATILVVARKIVTHYRRAMQVVGISNNSIRAQMQFPSLLIIDLVPAACNLKSNFKLCESHFIAT